MEKNDFGAEGCICTSVELDPTPDQPHMYDINRDCLIHKAQWRPTRDALPIPGFKQLIPGRGSVIYELPGKHTSNNPGWVLIICFALLSNGTADALVWSTRRSRVVPAQVFVDDEMRWNDKGTSLKYRIEVSG